MPRDQSQSRSGFSSVSAESHPFITDTNFSISDQNQIIVGTAAGSGWWNDSLSLTLSDSDSL